MERWRQAGRDRWRLRPGRRRASPAGTVDDGPAGRRHVRRGAPPLDFLLEPARLPTNWLGFTSLRAVVIGPTEWEQLNDAQKSALLTWTACGGDLIFVDGDLGTLLPGATAACRRGRIARSARYFFGRIHRPTSASIATAGLASVLSAAQKVQDANWALPANGARDWGAIAARGFRLPIPGVDGVPARAYLSILLVFSLLIGPVNYWFLRRKRQQVLLVLTAPLISAMFIVLLAGYVAGRRGSRRARPRGDVHDARSGQEAGRHARQRVAVRRRHDAVGWAALSARRGGVPDRPRRDRQPRPAGRSISPTRSASRRACIQARSPTNFEQIAFRPARERLSFSREAGGMTVVNGLGATVTALVYRDGDNGLHAWPARCRRAARRS